MIAMGPENNEFSNRIEVYDFTNEYRDSQCFIRNSPFPLLRTFEDRKKELQRRWNTIKTCLKIQIEEKGSKDVEIPENQNHCKIEKLSNKKVNLKGGVCFLKPFTDTHLNLRFILNDDCLQYHHLEKESVALDLKALLNFYTSRETSGSSIDITPLESVPLRVTIAPNHHLLPLSDDMGIEGPQFPSFLEIPDIHLGGPYLTYSPNGNLIIKPYFWIDHHCSSKCLGFLCQSFCDYAQPFFGKFDFYEREKNKTPVLISSWYGGGVSRPKFQGEINVNEKDIENFKFDQKKSYLLEVNFTDPKSDYEDFKADFFSKIQRIDHFPRGTLSNAIQQIPSIHHLNNVQKIPDGLFLPELSFSLPLGHGFENLRENFSNHFSYQAWPPYYDKVCGTDSCRSISNKPYLRLGIEFTGVSQGPGREEVNIEVLRQYRHSNLISPYEKEKPQMPEVTCPY